MKKSQLRQLILEELKGYSKYAPGGVTQGGTTTDFRNILTKIATDLPDEDEKYQGDPERGHKILDKANPENVKRIVRGEQPIKEEQGRVYKKQDVEWYLSRLEPNTKVTIPRIYPGGFSSHEGWTTTAQEALDAMKQAKLDGQFKLSQDNPDYKNFSLVQTPQQLKAKGDVIRGMGRLD